MMSGLVFPSPLPFTTSSDVTRVTFPAPGDDTLVPSHWSITVKPQSVVMSIVCMMWLGGHSCAAVAPLLPGLFTTGGVVSTTVTVEVHVEVLPDVSLQL